MCGISGYILKDPLREKPTQIRHLLEGIRQRGPDDEGVCLISRLKNTAESFSANEELPVIEHDVALLHTRYAIIDLSSGGHQPFVSRDGNITAVFNGEIYNYIELRKELSAQGVIFRTTSDTEVLVEGYRLWQEKLWPKLNGFWAVVLYEKTSGSVIFSRDRIGVAPLYYRETARGAFFSSYIQPLVDLMPEDVQINQDVFHGFLQTGFKDHNNSTYYENIHSFPSGSVLRLRKEQWKLTQVPVAKYWHLPSTRLRPSDMSFPEALKKFRDIFFNAVELRMRADVAVAFELSGGLDSSSIVAAAAQLQDSRVTTFTAKIRDADEEPFARSMLKRYRLNYHVLSRIEDNFLDDHGSFSRVMEEPYDNPNDYTHHRMLLRMKHQGINVVVTGAGGDETLAGYEASFWPKAYQEMKAQGGRSFWRGDWYEFCRRFKTWKRSAHTMRHYATGPFKRIIGRFPSDTGAQDKGLLTEAGTLAQEYPHRSFHQQQLFHFQHALVPYYMRSSDHFTMSIPVEHRFPLLDYRLIELGLRLPPDYLFRNGWTKYILRKAMEPYLPKKIVWRRRKMGFTFPYRQYFAAHAAAFQSYLMEPGGMDGSWQRFGSYQELLRKDPLLLWRVLSTAIWIKNNIQGRRINAHHFSC